VGIKHHSSLTETGYSMKNDRFLEKTVTPEKVLLDAGTCSAFP
jgi:hypothetical protein